MQIIRYKYPEKMRLDSSVIALGFFDGVHIAHRALIKKCIEIARTKGVASALLTFENDGGLKSESSRLYSMEERLSLIEGMGIERVILCDFESVKCLDKSEFVVEVLKEHLGAVALVAGYNFKYGRGASGNSGTLLDEGKETGIEVYIEGEIDDGASPISATAIRTSLKNGDIERANRMLVTPYHVSGIVSHGIGVGHKEGFPTVNISLQNPDILKLGVYITGVVVEGELYTGLTNIGTCPTILSREVHAETTILNFGRDIYDKHITIYFLEYLREEKRFASAEELRAQIELDKKRLMQRGEVRWQEIGLS